MSASREVFEGVWCIRQTEVRQEVVIMKDAVTWMDVKSSWQTSTTKYTEGS